MSRRPARCVAGSRFRAVTPTTPRRPSYNGDNPPAPEQVEQASELYASATLDGVELAGHLTTGDAGILRAALNAAAELDRDCLSNPPPPV